MKKTNKRGNVIATALIVTALLVATGIMLQRELYPPQRSDLHSTMSAFEQNVYATPDQLLQEYAMHGYQNGSDNFWFCVNRPSPPNLSRTKDDFAPFATNDLLTKLETLTKEYPEFNITVGSPVFQLEAPLLIEDLDPNVTTINITNLTITIKDGDRLIEKSLSQEEAYRMHFWLLYKGMQGWTKCGSADIYNSFKSTFLSKSCGFFKDTTICHPSEAQYCCKGPTPDKEKCDGSDPKLLQDFAQSERDSLTTAYGATVDDVQAAADLMAEDLTGAFNGQEQNWCGQTVNISPTGIKCSARIERPTVRNDFYSSYAFHNTGCLFQCPNTGGIVSIAAYDSFMCAGSVPVSEGACTIKIGNEYISGCGGVLGAALIHPDKQSEYLSAIEKAAAAVCVRREDGVVRCGDNAVTGDLDYNPLTECKYNALRSSNGIDGPWKETTTTASCNPEPADASGVLPDVGNDHYTVGDQKIKCLSNPADYNPSNGEWFGTNGWIDKKGNADIIITCQDPGTTNVKPIEAEIRMRVSFRHACIQPQRYRALAPPSCAAPGAGGDRTCADLDCDTGNPCYIKGCQMLPDDPTDPASPKHPACVAMADDRQPTTCAIAGNPCAKGTCSTGSPASSRTCDTSSPTTTSNGLPCGTTPDCNACKEGTCQPLNNDPPNSCYPRNLRVCEKGVCNAGDCQAVPNPTGTCYGGSCGVCSCTADGAQVTEDASKCDGQGTDIPDSCTTSTHISYTCQRSGSDDFNCAPPSGTPQPFDRSQCCAGKICPSGQDCHCGFCKDAASGCSG